MNISVLLPTRGRANRLPIFIDNIKDTASDPDNIEILFLIDDDDRNSKVMLENLGANYYIKDSSKNILFSDMWNQLIPHAKADIFLVAGDDVSFITKGWDKYALEEFLKVEDKILLVSGDDCIQHENLAVHPFIHRNWIDAVGYILPPYFKYWYADNWVTDVARGINRFKYMPHVVMQHVHHITGHDETYQKNELHIQEAGKVWNSTAHLRQLDIEKLNRFIKDYHEKSNSNDNH